MEKFLIYQRWSDQAEDVPVHGALSPERPSATHILQTERTP